MSNKELAVHTTLHKNFSGHPDLDFLVRDMQSTFLRLSANLRWYEQTWLGVPIWQLADDLVSLQSIVFDTKPKWIVETGTKFGGSAIFFASMLALMGETAETAGVITVDIEETDLASQFLSKEPHRLAPFIRKRLVGDAKAPGVFAEIQSTIATDPGAVLVFLDDWHDGDHVYAELQLYSRLVTPRGILIVADTTFEDLVDTPLGGASQKYPDVKHSNPRAALRRFLAERTDFQAVPDYTTAGISNFPDSVLRRIA